MWGDSPVNKTFVSLMCVCSAVWSSVVVIHSGKTWRGGDCRSWPESEPATRGAREGTRRPKSAIQKWKKQSEGDVQSIQPSPHTESCERL